LYRNLLMFLFITLLTACNQNTKQPLEGQPISDNPLLPLSTTNDTADPTEETKDKLDQTEEKTVITPIEQDVTVTPGYGIPQEEPANQKENQAETQLPKIPFAEFEDRWNAVADEQASNLYISSFEKLDENIFRTSIQDSLELRVFVVEDMVEGIMIRTRFDSSREILDMLTGWSQMVYVLESEVDPHQIDELFHELGVGPNLDINGLKRKSVNRNGIIYTVNPNEAGFELEAKYQ
jgi:hypothetical protein